MNKFAKIENDIVVQVQPHDSEGFVEVADSIFCGLIHDGSASYAEGSFTSPSDSLETKISQKQHAAQNIYQEKINDGFTFEGNVFQIRETDKLNMTAVMTDFNLGVSNAHGGTWRSMSNEMIPMTDAKVQEFIQAAKSYLLSLMQAYWQHKDALQEMGSVDLVNAYDITAGWPA